MSNEQKLIWIAWPTEPGFYWFYGWLYASDEKPELQPVVAQKGRNALMVHYWADFLYKSKVTGVFTPMQPPDTPDLDKMLYVNVAQAR